MRASCVRVCTCVCVCACTRACVRACVCVCAHECTAPVHVVVMRISHTFTSTKRFVATKQAIVLQVRLRGYDESENFTCLCQEV